MLQHHYSTFIATTGSSAPVLRVGTQVLAGSLLEPLPWHRNDRFPRSTQKPVLRSCYLHAGDRLASKQVTASLFPGCTTDPGFDLISLLTTRHQQFTCVHLLNTYLTKSCFAFSLTLTTMALNHRNLRRFEASSCKAASRGLPSSLVQHAHALLTQLIVLVAHVVTADRLGSVAGGVLKVPGITALENHRLDLLKAVSTWYRETI